MALPYLSLRVFSLKPLATSIAESADSCVSRMLLAPDSSFSETELLLQPTGRLLGSLEPEKG